MNKISVFVFPVMMIGMLSLGGCSRTTPTGPVSGGTYVSTNGGASFVQSAGITGSDTTIARFDLGKIHRSLQDSSLLFMASGKDGMVISKDDGVSWSVVKIPLTATIDVAQAKNGVLLASGVDELGQGIVTRSIDGGVTWQTVLTLPVDKTKKSFQLIKGGSNVSASVIALEIDPRIDGRVWAGTNDGTLFAGEQYGKTWRKVVDVSSNLAQVTGDRTGAGIVRLMVSPFHDATMLVVTKDKRLLEVTGSTVTEIKVPMHFDSPSTFGVSVGTQKVLSAVYVQGYKDALLVGTDTGAIISKDKGKTWTTLKLPLDASKILSSSVVAISPTNIARIFVVADGVMYRSEDGGVSWNTTDVGPVGYSVTDISINPKNAGHMLAIVKAPAV